VSQPTFDRILMVCTANICRSPMAEVLWRRQLLALDGNRTGEHVASAGTHALLGHPADPEACEVVAEWDLDLSAHRAQQVELEQARSFELILTMEQHHKRWIEQQIPVLRGRVHRLGHWLDADVPDPYNGPRGGFRAARDLIDEAVTSWLERLYR
jgi:protein-tyrosine phosphatase